MMERTCNNCRSGSQRVCHGCRDKSGWRPDYETSDARVVELRAEVERLRDISKVLACYLEELTPSMCARCEMKGADMRCNFDASLSIAHEANNRQRPERCPLAIAIQQAVEAHQHAATVLWPSRQTPTPGGSK